MFNLNKVRSFFQKKKQILVDGCCDTETTCCDSGARLRGYKVFYGDGGTPIEINDSSTLNATLNVGNKWGIYLETINNDVGVISIVVTPTIAGLGIASTPFTVYHPGNGGIVNANWGTSGTRLFTVNVTTNSGNFSFTAQIKVL
jgi:hypothetical protein